MTGPADAPDLLPRTLAELPFFVSGRHPKPGLIGRCVGGEIGSMSGKELVERVRDFSLGLSTFGLAASDRVLLLSESRPEWIVADLAILAAGAVTVPVYPTVSDEQLAFIVRDSGARMAIVSNRAHFDKLVRAASGADALTIVMIDGDAPAELSRNVYAWEETRAAGHKQITAGWGVARSFHDRAKSVRPDDLATLIYTSGTTGEAKGVELTHGNLVSNLDDLSRVLLLDEGDAALSFLPLCHAFERMAAYLYLVNGVTIVFAESIDTIARDLVRVRPTVMTGVPRVFEKVLERVRATGQAQSWLQRGLFEWAMRVADKRGEIVGDGRLSPSTGGLSHRLADRLVFRRVREGLGGRLRMVVCGSAPLRPDVGRTFLGMGVPILEGYGLTETSPAVSVNPLSDIRFGTVGKCLPSVQATIAEDGELLVRGPNVMRGYYHRDADTAAVLWNGWLRTGDIGSIDADGYIRITDRKKNLLVTSGGKKLAPQPIEDALRAHPLIAEAVVIGDGRRFPSVLVVPDFAALAAQAGVARTVARSTLVSREDVRARFQVIIDAVNEPLAQFERLKRFALLADEFSVESGHLTATLKVKRRVVEARYQEIIEALYEERRES